MMMTTERIPVCRAVDDAILAMAMTMTTARVRRTHWAVSQGPEKAREQWMGRGKGRRLRMGRGKGRGRGKEAVKGRYC
jgi:hypothetical protein